MRAADVKEAHLAKRLRLNRGMLHQYLSGRCHPSAEIVRKVDRQVERLVGGPSGIALFLDCTAMKEGMVPIDHVSLAKTMVRALEGLERRGLLVPDWRRRFTERFDNLDDEQVESFRKVIEALAFASQRPLFDDLTGKTPVTTFSWQPVREALSSHGFGELVREPSAFQINLDAFVTELREVLLAPPRTVHDRLDAEVSLTAAAIRFACSGADDDARTFADEDLIEIANAIGVRTES